LKWFAKVTHNGLALGEGGDFTTNVDAENQALINHKCVCGALNRHFCQTPVCAPHERRPLFASYSKSLKMQIKF